jgi:Tetratricopeptide repeat
MASEQQASVVGSGNIVIQNSGDYAHITVGVPYLTLIRAQTRIDQAQARVKSEIDLLNPFNRAVELVGREKDLESLWQWLHSDRPIAVRTLTGRAGAGKTRLAVELMTRLSNEAGQWRSGFVTNTELRRFSDQQNLSTWEWQSPTLVTVDYAATLAQPLKMCLQELSENIQNCNGKPLRVLLLEREASAEEGWFRSLLGSSWSGAGVAHLFDPLEPIRVQKLDTAANRRQVFTSMLRVSAEYLNRPSPTAPALGQRPQFDRQLEAPIWSNPLYLMMAALVSIRSGIIETLALSGTDLAFRLAEREIDRLKCFAPSQGGEGAQELLVHMAAYATLCNGLSADQALEAATQEGNALQLQYHGGYGALRKTLHGALPGKGNGIAPVVPDLIGEALVLSALGHETQQAAVVLRGAKQVGRVVPAFVVRAAQDFSDAGLIEPLEWLQALIEAGRADDIGLLLEIEGAMPEHTLVLREKAAEVSQLLVDRLSELGSQLPEEIFRSELGRLTNNLAVRLGHLGRREEALEKAQQAVSIREQLAQASPDAFRPTLADSLNNLAVMLSELGRRQEALEKAQQAVSIYEQLAQARPDAFLPNLARSISWSRRCLRALDRLSEAATAGETALRLLTPFFQQLPIVYAELMAAIFSGYVDDMAALDREPDEELLAPVIAIFEKLQQNETEE